jgi:HK97 family phage prohead protease
MKNASCKRAEFDLVDVKMLGEETDHGGFDAYVAIYGNVDRTGERIREDAVKNVESFIRDGWSSFDHFGTKFPIGTIKDARQDARGFWISVEFHSTAEAQEARKVIKERLERRKAVKCSILYRVLADEVKEGVRDLLEIEVFEAGAVMLPANTDAGVTGAKSDAIDPPEPNAGRINALYLRHLHGRGSTG